MLEASGTVDQMQSMHQDYLKASLVMSIPAARSTNSQRFISKPYTGRYDTIPRNIPDVRSYVDEFSILEGWDCLVAIASLFPG